MAGRHGDIVGAGLHIALLGGTGCSPPGWSQLCCWRCWQCRSLATRAHRPAEDLAAVVTGIAIAFITVASLLAAVWLVVDILTSNKLCRA